jgi:O26-antigen biosynthesis N-acetyl-L-fucosamine transferase
MQAFCSQYRETVKVLLIVDCYSPYAKSGAIQMQELALELSREGCEVVVLTPSDRISEKTKVDTEDGVTVVRVKTRKIKGSPKVFRAIAEANLSNLCGKRTRGILPNAMDLIIFYSPSIFWGRLVRQLKARWQCSSYLILRDVFPAWAVDAGLLRKGLLYSYFRKKEIEQYDTADWIAVQSPANLDYFAREFPSREYCIEVLYNWMDPRRPVSPITHYRQRLGLEGKVVFFYGGNIGVAQDVDNLLRLARRLACDHHIHFVLVGEGSEVPRLEQRCREECIRNLAILPAVSHPEYLAMLSEFDVGLLSLDRRLKTHNVPGKLLGYMYWSKPILASINPGNDLFGILGRNEAGYCLVNGDDEGLAAAALQLAKNVELRHRMGQNSRKLLERVFSVQTAARQILSHVEPVCNNANEVEDDPSRVPFSAAAASESSI